MTVTQRNLSAEIADIIRGRIIDGHLVPGERINEVHMAEELSVSRTPVREGLATLVSEGFLTTRPRRGVFVKDLADQEIEQIYLIRAILDPSALELAGLPGPDRLLRLEDLNQQILSTRGQPARTIDVDDEWHLELLAGCSNDVLLDLIQQLMARTRPYEYAYMREHSNVDVVVREHAKIIARLASGDLTAACVALRENMQSAVAPLLEWRALQQNQQDHLQEVG